MSLFLGNLSSHIRQDELERVFRRFGRCNVQLKDGYGFVVYDLPTNAEKALSALRGKNICREPISLTWSNKQPRPFQRMTRGSRFYEPNRGRNVTRREAYGMRKMGSHDERDFKLGTKRMDNDGTEAHMVDLPDKETVHLLEDIENQGGEKCHNSKDRLLDKGGIIEPNPVDDDRWGEPVSDPLNANASENGADFDRYEPYHGYDTRNDNENHGMTSSYGSLNLRSSQEKARREHSGELILKHPDKPKPTQTCYICGLKGHIMRNCPRADAYRGKKFTRFDRRHGKEINFRGRGQGELKRPRRASWGRQSSIEDPLLLTRQKSDKKASGSRKTRRLARGIESFPVSKEAHRSQLRMDSQGKRRERGTQKKHGGKKARRSESSPLRSDSPASSSCLRSSSSKTGSGFSSRSRSRSVSSRRYSVTSRSRSTSSSSYSRSESSRSRSRSRSRSPTSLSLSIPPVQPSELSANKVQVKAASASLECHLESVTSPQSKHLLFEHRQLVEGNSSSENSKLGNTSVAEKDENTLLSIKAKDEKNVRTGKQDDVGNHSSSKTGHELKNPLMAPLEKVAFTVHDSSSYNFKERTDVQVSMPLLMEHTQAPVGKSQSEVPAGSQINNSTSISPQEMYMTLKHYGLPVPEENENHLSVEAYFGSARLWPWEIIYYRRLKKGPISTKNYARRIAQNGEFGIVDKYIRSSSGWGECDKKNS